MASIRKFVPPAAKRPLRKVKQFISNDDPGRSRGGRHLAVLNYYPEAYGHTSFAIAKSQSYQNEGEHDGLPIPPRPHWIGNGNDFGDRGAEWYIAKGKSNTDQMMDIVAAGGFSPAHGGRILELGCAAGRMIRHLKRFTSSCEIWGVHISAWLVNWCKVNSRARFTSRRPQRFHISLSQMTIST